MQNKLEKVKDFLFRKKVILPLIALVLVAYFFVFKGNDTTNISVITPTYGELVQSVRATGQVTSKTDLNLSFGKQGIVNSLKVEVGDKVYTGQVLASLDAGSDYAEVTKARGTLASAEAKLQKVLDGASNEEIKLAEVALNNAKSDYENTKNTQATLVANAYNKLLNSSPEAVPEQFSGSSVTAPTISGTYNKQEEGDINIKVYTTGSGLAFSLSGLVSGVGYVNTTTPQALGDSGLYILFSSNINLSGTNWIVSIPNKKASDYLTNENSYYSALKTKEATLSSGLSLIAQREAELELKKASARSADVALAEADVLSARGGLEKAQAMYEDNIIRAPGNGTITKVDVKYGELAEANNPAIVLQDVENLYIEALINESNIASIKTGQIVEVTFDALTEDKFTGVVSHIDPSSQTEDGVVNYKIKVSINEKNAYIRPGMNAEISVIALKKENVVSVPKASVVERDGKAFVNVITNEDKKQYKEVEVVLGAKGDGSMVEVLSGVKKEDKIALISNN